ncbi:hypothetical protein KY290_010268 [Solanum tuberosum]|uniref:Integrase catalytic domain-containing protein n=1 Tax=Solanum tuberosum TaxID=4113 RepID=A0ABQ7VYJ1_SOLTU|nr:hypothetical protein KY290_010268 [Solanum tuberosum]
MVNEYGLTGASTDRASTNRDNGINGSFMTIDHNHPLHLSSSDVSQLTGMDNYTLWSRAMEIALLGRNKLGFIDGSVLQSDFDGPLKKIWDRCNAIVITWLTSNVSKDLLSGIHYSSSANQDESKKGIAGSIHEGMESLAMYSGRATGADCNKLKKCDNCNATGHVKDNCYLLIGYPDNFKSKRKGSNHKEEVKSHKEQLLKMMKNSSPTQLNQIFNVLNDNNKIMENSQKSACMAGNPISTSISSLKWIIDTWATDHMIHNHNHLHSKAMVRSSGKVKLPTDLLSGKVKGIGDVDDGLYVLNWNADQQQARFQTMSTVRTNNGDPALWHKRLGHVPMQTRVSFPVSHIVVDEIFDLIHMDVCGPYKNQFGKCVKVFRSDNGGEFLNSTCHDLFVMHGIIHQRSCPYTPQQNGVVKRKHRHLLETATNIKFQECLPKRFWGDCVEAATYIINKIPLSVLGNKSPYELFYHKSPSLAHIKVIGCLVFATNLRRNDKFAPKANKAVFLGYAVSQKGYKLLDIESKLVFVSRDVLFFKDIFPFQATGLDEANELEPTMFTHTNDGLTPCVVFWNMDQNQITSVQPAPTQIDSQVSQDHVSQDQNQVPLVQYIPNHIVVTRRSNRPAKPPIWHTNYILTKKKTTCGDCSNSIANAIDYQRISPTYRSYVTKFSQEGEPFS